MPSSMRSDYGSVPAGSGIRRSQFDISENHKTTFDGDYLVPIYWNYFYPGEVVRGGLKAFVRMSSPLDFPLMDNMKLTCHWYSTPIRQVWANFRKMFGEREDPGDSIDYTVPEVGAGSVATDAASGNRWIELLWYLGVPIVPTVGVDQDELAALPFRTYHHIYNWHYRDTQQQDSLDVPTDDGPDTGHVYEMKKRGKRFDYFTAATLAPQRGETVGATADVTIDTGAGSNPSIVYGPTGTRYELDANAALLDVSATTGGSSEKLYTELLISELRNAVAIQQFLERDNRYGTRYDELIFAHYGSEFRDIRVAPQYLGGGSGYINTSSIPNQSGSSGNVGDLAAIAHGSLDGARFTYAFDEPSILMCIVVVSADQTYQRGLDKKWSLRTRYDFFTPEFNRIGDQALLSKELWFNNDGASGDDTVFGYVPRNEHMRIGINRVSGEFASEHNATLDSWHLATNYATRPVLGDTWISSDSPYSRVQQVATQHDFIADFQIELKAARQLPVYGVPGLARL